MTTKIAAVFVSLLLACASKPAPTTTTPPAPASTPFTIVELKVLDGDDPGFMLHADGRIEMNHRAHKGDAPTWTTVGKLTADGKLVKEDGTEVGALQPDGTFKLAKGEAPFKFDGEVLVSGDKRITVDDKGVIQGGNPGFALHVEGATDAGSRRAALLLLAIATAGKVKVEGPAEVTTPATVQP
jgi:hypothetical protein